MARYKFEEIFDVERLHRILDNFSKFNGLANAIIDLEGNIISACGWKDACTKFHRVNPITSKRCLESDTELLASLNKGNKYTDYICKNGLVDVAVPLYVADEYLANFFIGQFFYEPPDIERFEKLADEVGFDKKEYIDAIKRVPVVPRARARMIAEFLAELVMEIGGYGVTRLELVELNDELNEHRKHLEDLVCERTSDLEEAVQKAEAANQAKSEFLANMSHEIRTPMNAILGFAEILHNKIKEPELAHHTETILTSAKALLSLINGILDLSKVEAGKLELQYSAVSLTRLLDEVRMIFMQKVLEKGLDFNFQISDDIPQYLMLDPVRIKQILINMIGNSIKFTDDGYISVTVTVSSAAEREGGKIDLSLAVEDTGIGIPADQLDIIFDAFEQTKGQDEVLYGGTGLGLAITRRLVEMMGGTITVSSEVGVGTKFVVALQGVEITSEEDQPAMTDDEKLNKILPVRFQPAKILVCDDIIFNRELIIGFLEEFDFTIFEAVNGREALEIAGREHPDLILLDMKMPVMDGYQASDILKNTEETAEIPIVAITASALKNDEELIRRVCDGYLRKPIGRSQLILEIMNFLPYESIKKSENSAKRFVDINHKVEFAKVPKYLQDDIFSLLSSEKITKESFRELLLEVSIYSGLLAEELDRLTDEENYEEIRRLLTKT